MLSAPAQPRADHRLSSEPVALLTATLAHAVDPAPVGEPHRRIVGSVENGKTNRTTRCTFATHDALTAQITHRQHRLADEFRRGGRTDTRRWNWSRHSPRAKGTSWLDGGTSRDPYRQVTALDMSGARACGDTAKRRRVMPHAPLARDAVSGARDQTGSPTRSLAPVTPVRDSRTARVPLARCAAGDAQTAPPSTIRPHRTGSAPAKIRGGRLRHVAGLLRRGPKTSARYHDPLFERPDLIEDDYYRLHNQHYG